MTASSAARRHHYTSVAKLIHWLVAGAIVLQFVLAKLAENAEHAGERVAQLGLLANHKSVGMTVLTLAFLRIAWRATHPAPALPTTMPGWQRSASHLSHIALYMLIVLVPLTGWLMSSASAYSVSWFNLFVFPDLIGADPDHKHALEGIHDFFAKLLFIFAAVHMAAGLKHWLLDRDGVMGRISSVPALGLFVATVAAGVAFLATGGPSRAATGAAEAASEESAPAASAELRASSLPVWEVDQAASRISFTGDQAGAAFTGRWTAFGATLQFDAKRLGDARFDVTIETSSPDTGDEERDTTMTDSEWFHSDKFPQAVYRAESFETTDTGFVANGQLLIKSTSRATPFYFDVERDGDRRILTGRATLDRLAFNLGTGDWTDTTWVGQTVEVNVRIEAQVPAE